MPYKEKEVLLEDAQVQGTVISDDKIKLQLYLYREQRDGTYERTLATVWVDINSVLCVRDTMRMLAKEALTKRQEQTDRLENWLANPHR